MCPATWPPTRATRAVEPNYSTPRRPNRVPAPCGPSTGRWVGARYRRCRPRQGRCPTTGTGIPPGSPFVLLDRHADLHPCASVSPGHHVMDQYAQRSAARLRPDNFSHTEGIASQLTSSVIRSDCRCPATRCLTMTTGTGLDGQTLGDLLGPVRDREQVAERVRRRG